MVARNSDWFIVPLAPAVIGGVLTLVLGFRQSFENRPIRGISSFRRVIEWRGAKFGGDTVRARVQKSESTHDLTVFAHSPG